MPPKRMQHCSRQRRGRGKAQQIATIKKELRLIDQGRFATKMHTISLPPWMSDAKMYRTVRLQNNNGDPDWLPAIKSIFQAMQPAFQYFQLVSMTGFGPYIASSGFGDGELGDLFNSEISFNAGINFYQGTSGTLGIYYAHPGPAKVVAPGAGRRGCVRWHWSARDSAFQFNAYGSSLAFAQMTYQARSTDVDPVLFRKDSYIDVTIQGWGRRTTFDLDDIYHHQDLMPHDGPPQLSEEQLSVCWEQIKLEDTGGLPHMDIP